MKKNQKKYFAHKSSIIDEPSQIGNGSKIWHFCHVMAGAKIGENCVLGQNVYVGSEAKIGDGVRIQNNVSIYDGVELENNVFCGPSCVFTNDMNPRSNYPKHGKYLKTVVRDGASIGANVTIVCGTTIGKNAFVGAGAVVTKDIPDHALVVGVPARIIGWMCECGEKIDFLNYKSKCANCGKKYIKNGENVKIWNS